MGYNLAKVTFQDSMACYALYNDTSDVLEPSLFSYDITVAEAMEIRNARGWAICTGGHVHESVVCQDLSGDRPFGEPWEAKACRICLVVTDGFSPFPFEPYPTLETGVKQLSHRKAKRKQKREAKKARL